MHPLVPTQVGELRVGLQAHLAGEWLDAAVDVRVLLQTTGRRKSLSALRARVAPGALVLRANVAVQVAGIREALSTVFAGIHPVAVMGCLVLDQIRFPVEASTAFIAGKLFILSAF